MLCYRYSQSATDNIHDTFAWLTDNRRAALSIALPILIVCAFAIYYIHIDIYGIIDRTNFNPFQFLFNQVLPFSDPIYDTSSAYAPLMFGLMAGVTTLFTVPLLRRYFVDRRSLFRLKSTDAAVELRRHLWHALPPAIITGLTFYTAEGADSFWSALLLMLVCTFIVPSFIMGRWSGIIIVNNIWLIIKSLFFITIVVCIVRDIPWIFISLLALALDLINDILPGAIQVEESITDILSYAFSALLCLSFCSAVAVYLVSTLMLHGSIYPIPDEKTIE